MMKQTRLPFSTFPSKLKFCSTFCVTKPMYDRPSWYIAKWISETITRMTAKPMKLLGLAEIFCNSKSVRRKNILVVYEFQEIFFKPTLRFYACHGDTVCDKYFVNQCNLVAGKRACDRVVVHRRNF